MKFLRLLIGIGITLGFLLLNILYLGDVFMSWFIPLGLGLWLSLMWEVGAVSNYKEGFKDGQESMEIKK